MLWLALACIGVLKPIELEFELGIAPWEAVHTPHIWWNAPHSRFEIAAIARNGDRRALCTAFQPYRVSGAMGIDCSAISGASPY